MYDYILRAANERIGTAKRDFVKRECKQVIQIITQLQDGNSTDDIVRAILSPKWNKVRNEAVATDIEENSNEFDNEQCHEQSDNRQDNGWKVIENLENHPLLDREYCQQLPKRVEVLHQNGELDKEIRFIRETIQSYESVGLPCKYWHLLLTVRTAETAKRKNIELITPAVSQIIDRLTNTVPQIINGLTVNAIRREAKQAIEAKLSLSFADKTEKTFNRVEIPIHDQYDNDVRLPESVPYWEHIYVYSVADLQKATLQQKQFYRYFKAQFLKKCYLDIEDNSNYAFMLMFDFAADYTMHKDYDLLEQQLNTLAEKYPVVASYINRTILQVVKSVKQKDVANTLQSYDKSRGQLCRWVTPNETIEVQGIKLTRGNFYIGECFRLPDNFIRENSFSNTRYQGVYIYGSVLNPDLPVTNIENTKNAFCSYNDMCPAWRHEYLMWLSGKCVASDVSIEILLFYLYGCEIRMFIDSQTNKSERRSILLESIEMLKSLNMTLPENGASFLRQELCDFIGCAIIKYFCDGIEKFNLKGLLKNCNIYQEYYIAYKIEGKTMLSSEDAFNIANDIYDIEQLVTPQYISFARKYFTDDFMGLYKNLNMDFETTTATLIRSVCKDNGYFKSESINLYYTVDSLCGLWRIHNVINSCYWSVESKFRYYNRVKERSGGKETIAAILLLPNDINIKKEVSQIQALITHIENEIQADQYLIKPIDWLLELWEYECKGEKSILKEYADSIIGGLRRLGYGIVPNYEIGRRHFNFGDIS